MIRNLSKNTVISRQPYFAVRLRDRMQGMIHRTFDGFDAMVFPRCSAIHMLFMQMPLDVIFVDGSNRAAAVYKELRPWKPCVWCPSAITVIEMPSGSLAASGTERGDVLDLNAETADERESARTFVRNEANLEYNSLTRRT